MEKRKTGEQQVDSRSDGTRAVGVLATSAMVLTGLAIRAESGASSHTDDRAVPIEVTVPGPEIGTAIQEVNTTETENSGEISAATGEHAEFTLPYAHDFRTKESDAELALSFMSNYVAEHMAVFADSSINISSLIIDGSASAEHGNSEMAGLDTPFEGNDELAAERAVLGRDAFERALREAMPGNPDRVAQILEALDVTSHVNELNEEQLSGLKDIAEKHGVSVNTLVDDFNQNPKRLIAVSEQDIQYIKELLRRGFDLDMTYETAAEVVAEQPAVEHEIVVESHPSDVQVPVTIENIVRASAGAAQHIIQKEKARLPEDLVRPEVATFDPRFPSSRHLPKSQVRGSGPWDQRRMYNIQQARHGNFNNKTRVTHKQAGKGKPGSSHSVGRKGRTK